MRKILTLANHSRGSHCDDCYKLTQPDPLGPQPSYKSTSHTQFMASNAHTSKSDKYPDARTTTTRCGDNDKRKNSTVCHFGTIRRHTTWTSSSSQWLASRLIRTMFNWLGETLVHSHSVICTISRKRLLIGIVSGREAGESLMGSRGIQDDKEDPLSDVVLSLHRNHYKTVRKDWNGISTDLTERWSKDQRLWLVFCWSASNEGGREWQQWKVSGVELPVTQWNLSWGCCCRWWAKLTASAVSIEEHRASDKTWSAMGGCTIKDISCSQNRSAKRFVGMTKCVPGMINFTVLLLPVGDYSQFVTSVNRN